VIWFSATPTTDLGATAVRETLRRSGVDAAAIGTWARCVVTRCVGAGAVTRRAVGAPVFGGMLAASLFGIFVIPLLYVTAEQARQWQQWGRGRKAK
jgi:hypothetical protein